MSINLPVTSKPRIVIIGGGFGGLELAKRLRKTEAQIVLLDKNNYHTFQPLLYQVATAAMEAESIAYPFREIFQGYPNVSFRMAEVRRINTGQNSIETSIGDIPYEYLVVAVGSKTNFFGMRDIAEFSMPMKSIPEAIALRNLILENFECALLESDLQKREGRMNIVVIGGGPTGVETAGALGELRKHILPRDYPELDFKRMQIHVVDREDRLLKAMSAEASRSAEDSLKKFDVNLWLGTSILSYNGKTVFLSNGKQLITDTVIWAAGVTGALIPGLPSDAIAPGNRIKVDLYNRMEGHPNIFALGDCAAMITDDAPKGHPMLAPVAIQQAKNLAGNLKRILAGNNSLTPFVYKDLGVMATIGRNLAVADFKFVKLQGIFAWFVWVFVHLMTLVGFRNKIIAFVNWAWNYASYDRSLRLIIRPFKRES